LSSSTDVIDDAWEDIVKNDDMTYVQMLRNMFRMMLRKIVEKMFRKIL